MPDPRGPDPNRLLIAALIGLVICLVAGALFAQPLPQGRTLDSRDAIDASQRAIGNALGDYTLIDADRGAVRLADLRGKPLVLSFVYTGCFQVCRTTTEFLGRALVEAERALGRDAFNVVTVGFNQPFDTPSAMREFRRRHAPELSNWAFLSASAGTVEALAADVGFRWATSAGGFDHVTQVSLIDSRGRLVRQVYGEAFELPMLVTPLKELVTGAPMPVQNLSGLLERIRVLCTVYDPRAGRYSLDYRLVIELVAGVSILGFTLFYLMREWRRHRRLRVS